MLIELLGAVKRERDALDLDRRLPKVLVKIAPDLSKEELSDVAEAVRETGIDGVIVSNTTTQRPNTLRSSALLPYTMIPYFDVSIENKAETGGLSGPPLKHLTLNALKTLRPLLSSSIPIIGCGGITTGADAIEFAKAGATTVQVYTSFTYGGAGTPRRIKDEITQILAGSNQTWMDVVKEGQKLALVDPKEESSNFKLEGIRLRGNLESIQQGADKLAEMGEQLIGILKTGETSDSNKEGR
jgi:dihydroorotate dehydrogenase